MTDHEHPEIETVQDEVLNLLSASMSDESVNRWNELVAAGRSPMVPSQPHNIGDWAAILREMASAYSAENLPEGFDTTQRLDPFTLRLVARMLDNGKPIWPDEVTCS